MKVIIEETERNEFGYKYISGVTIGTSTRELTFYDLSECPEDATFNRGLSDIFRIEHLLEDAYNAGRNGEELIISHTKGEE